MSQANRPAPCRNQGKSREVRAKQMSGRVAACESRRSAAGGTLDLAPNCAAERPTGGVCPHRETHRGRTFVLCRRRRTSPSGATYVSVGGDLGQKDRHGGRHAPAELRRVSRRVREREPSPDKAAATEEPRSPFRAALCRRPPVLAAFRSPRQPGGSRAGSESGCRARHVARSIQHKPSVRCRTDNRGP
jgi:hypothetical protein